MPGIYRLAYGKNVLDAVAEARSYGVHQVVIFPKTPDHLKTPTAEEAFNPNGLSQRTISLLKDAYPDLEVYTDVALDPYNSDGHDGIVGPGAIADEGHGGTAGPGGAVNEGHGSIVVLGGTADEGHDGNVPGATVDEGRDGTAGPGGTVDEDHGSIVGPGGMASEIPVPDSDEE